MSGFGNLIGASTVFHKVDIDDGSPIQTGGSNKAGLIAGIVVAGVVLILASLITFVYCIRRRAKVTE